MHLAGIDIVSSGQRVRRVGGYAALYSTLLADRPAAGRRDTYLIVRIDITGSVPGLTYRASIGAAAAAATERIINALLQDGIRASALNAAELDTALTELGVGLVTPPPRPGQPADDQAPDEVPAAPAGVRAQAQRAASPPKTRWRSVHTREGYLSSYYFSPEDITTAGLNQMWAAHR